MCDTIYLVTRVQYVEEVWDMLRRESKGSISFSFGSRQPAFHFEGSKIITLFSGRAISEQHLLSGWGAVNSMCVFLNHTPSYKEAVEPGYVYIWSPHAQLTSQKKFQFRHLESQKKKSNLTIDLLSLGIYAPGPQVLTYRPQILQGVRI